MQYADITKRVNIDESMVPYFGKFGNALKQHMPNKPIWFGYKIWYLNLEGGCLYHFDVYQGKGSQNQYTKNFGCGPGVVLGLLDSLPSGNFGVYIDNYFVSLNLLKHLATKGIGCTGTLRANMLQDCPANVNSFVKKQKKAIMRASWIKSQMLLYFDGMTMGM